MKKKLVAMALCVLTAFSLVACSGDGTTTTANGEKLKLGQYKGVKVDASLKEVTQDALDNFIRATVESFAETEEVKEGTLEKDMQIKISYSSTIEGEEYRNGEGVSLELTAESFPVEGFVEGLIGKNVGDEVSLDLKLPDDYDDTAYAGKDISFKVKIEAILVTTVPEFTDALVAENFGYRGQKTTDDYIAYAKVFLRQNQALGEVWEEIVDNTTVEKYDEKKLEDRAKEVANDHEMQIYNYLGMDLKSYLEAAGMTEEEYMNDAREVAKDYLKDEMVIRAIAVEEKITVSDEAYQERMLEFAKSYGLDTVAELEEKYKDVMTKEDFEYAVLQYMVQDFVADNVEYVEGFGLRNEETTTEATTQEATTEDAN